MKTIDLIKQEEYYQGLRTLIDRYRFAPDQGEACLDLFKAFGRLPKGQFKGFIERYKNESLAGKSVPIAEDIFLMDATYSILEKLAVINGIEVRKCDLEEKLGPGYACLYQGNGNGKNKPVISLHTGLSGWKLNHEFAIALGYPQIMVDHTYGNMITCQNRAKKERFDKQAHNIAALLIDGIASGLVF